MKTTQDYVEEMLLEGRHITKFDLLNVCRSVCLAQRILDIRQEKNWSIRSKSVEGKGTLKEYWLEKDEIERIKGKSSKNEQSIMKKENHLQTSQNEPYKEQQLGFGLFGGEI